MQGTLARSVLGDECGNKADHRKTTIPDFGLGREAKFPSIAIGCCDLSGDFISGLHGVYSRTRLFELMLTNITKSVKVLLVWNIRTGSDGCRHCCPRPIGKARRIIGGWQCMGGANPLSW